MGKRNSFRIREAKGSWASESVIVIIKTHVTSLRAYSRKSSVEPGRVFPTSYLM